MTMRDEVKLLMEAASGPLKAEEIVEAARDKKKFPALHDHLWGVGEAELAMEARVARAHKLMLNVYVTVGAGEKTRLYVHTQDTHGYQPLAHIIANSDLAVLKLRQLSDDIRRARGRLRAFRAAIPETVGDEIDDLLARAEAQATAAASRQAGGKAA